MTIISKSEEKISCLELALGPLSHWYKQENVEEIAINRPEQIWLRLRGETECCWVMYEDKQLSKNYLSDLLFVIAHTYKLPFNPTGEIPVIYASIPGGFTLTAIVGKNVMYDEDDCAGGVALTIRSNIGNSVLVGDGDGLKQDNQNNPSKKIKSTENSYERLLLGIEQGKHILVSGKTFTSKMTFLNNFLEALDDHKRVVMIEEMYETRLPQPNHVHVVIPRTEVKSWFDYEKAFDLTIRLLPDLIISDEISVRNAGMLWKLMEARKCSCLAMVHAQNPDEVYEVFANRIVHICPELDWEKTITKIRCQVMVVQVDENGNICMEINEN